jgi:hypothetical protein
MPSNDDKNGRLECLTEQAPGNLNMKGSKKVGIPALNLQMINRQHETRSTTQRIESEHNNQYQNRPSQRIMTFEPGSIDESCVEEGDLELTYGPSNQVNVIPESRRKNKENGTSSKHKRPSRRNSSGRVNTVESSILMINEKYQGRAFIGE